MRSKKKLLIATRNEGKLKEFISFLSDLPLTIISLQDLGIAEEVDESGKTYKENSQKKALFYSKISNLPTIADDGGIEIEALGGQPGAKTRRWLGFEMSDEEIISHLTKIAKDFPDNKRKAFFKTVVSLALPNGKVWSVFGKIEGIMAKKPYPKPLKGYPFRSFFYLPKIQKYYHENELSEEEQKLYNHRYKAIAKLKPVIRHVILTLNGVKWKNL